MQASMEEITAKQYLLTGYFELLLRHLCCWSGTKPIEEYDIKSNRPEFEIITPSDPNQRGAQLSLLFCKNVVSIQKQLMRRGVIVSRYLMVNNCCTCINFWRLVCLNNLTWICIVNHHELWIVISSIIDLFSQKFPLC